MSDTSGSWDKLDDADDNGYDSLGFDEDEDEFGLPSLSTARRRQSQKRKNGTTQTHGPIGSAISGNLPASTAAGFNSGDIAEERGLPNYPTAKQSQGKILRPQYKDILRGEEYQDDILLALANADRYADPANSLHLIDHPPLPGNASAKESQDHAARVSRINKFKRILQSSSIPLPDLRNSAWSGLPQEVRAITWQVLLGYLPTSSERRVATLERKRKEYLEGVRQAFERGSSASERQSMTNAGALSHRALGRGLDEAVWHQISIDVPRTNPHLELYAYEATQRSLERILYVWAIRHPASGYVQGINDLVTPFWQVFLATYITDPDVEFGMDPGQLPKPVLDAVEADSFWCLSKLLDGIQDNYVHAQPGIQRQVASLRDLTKRIDVGLVNHMEREGVEFMQFSFRWMNCLLMREVSVKNVIRMWDTYLVSLKLSIFIRD